jgi:signal transduction histidine kinase
MDYLQVAETIAKGLFGLCSLGAVAWLIKILTDINKNQREQIQILRDQYAEREKTKDQHIAFLESHHEKEKAFLERQRDSLTEQIDGEKRLLEQRMLLLEERYRQQGNQVFVAYSAHDVSTPKGIRVLQPPSRAKEDEFRDLSLMFSHNIRSQLGALAAILRNFPPSHGGLEEVERLREITARLNDTGHALGAVSDRAVRKTANVNILETLERAVAKEDHRDVTVKIEDTIRNLPDIESDPNLLDMVFSELLSNAAVHAAKPEVVIRGKATMESVSIAFINEIAHDILPESLTGFFKEPSFHPKHFGYGLYLVKHLTDTLAGQTEALIEKGDRTHFVVEVTLPHKQQKEETQQSGRGDAKDRAPHP